MSNLRRTDTYDITDQKQVVREIKKYLHAISTHTYPEITRGTVDGIYDNETRASVKKFQALQGLPETGVVDYITFLTLADEYGSIKTADALPDSLIEYQSFPMIYGDMSEDVRLLNMMITELSKIYKSIGAVGSDNYYSKRTVKAIKEIEKIFNLEITGITDAILYDRIKEELNSHKRNRKTDDLKSVDWQ